jgi:hypothetical protein
MRHPRDERNYSARLQAPIPPPPPTETNNKALELHVGATDVLIPVICLWYDLTTFHKNQMIY